MFYMFHALLPCYLATCLLLSSSHQGVISFTPTRTPYYNHHSAVLVPAVHHLLSIRSSSSPTTTTTTSTTSTRIYYSSDQEEEKEDENDIAAAVIIPGFLTGANELQSLVDNLNERGIPSIAVPMPNWHWIPCLGGRSVRPILERVDATVKYVYEHGIDSTAGAKIQFDYNFIDCYQDFMDNPGGIMKVGGSDEVDEYPTNVIPRGKLHTATTSHHNKKKKRKGRIALIGHSAGGWIGRIYLSNCNYGGKVYDGSKYVHSLVTLGTPHGNAPNVAFKSIQWINDKQPNVPTNIRALAVAGTGFKGDSSGQFTQNAYAFCCNEGSDGSKYDGDGVTPLDSALALYGPTCEQLVLQGRVTHFPWSDVFGGDLVAPELTAVHKEERTAWYGSDEALDQWVNWLNADRHKGMN